MLSFPRNRDILILAALCALCFFWRLGSVGLFDTNEGLYVEAAREMVLRSDYVTGRDNGVPFFDKPPLALWLDAISFHVFGFTEFAARLPVAISATALVFLTYIFGARWFGRRAGLLAAAFLALSPLFIGTARQMTMDIHQSLWVGAAMFCYFAGWSATTRQGKWWYLGFWASCGLGFLAKSVPGLFPIGCAFVFTLFEEHGRPRRILARIAESKPIIGFAILLAIVAPWHVLAYQRFGRYFYDQYWALHHVKLFTGQEFSHSNPFWYYVPALVAGFFPWSLFLPWAIWSAVRMWRQQGEAAAAHRFVLVWCAVFFFGFSGMTSKLLSYLLPMYAAAGLLVGEWLARELEERRVSALRWVSTTTALCAAAAFWAGTGFLAKQRALEPVTPGGLEFPPAGLVWALHAIVLAGVAALAAAILAWLRRPFWSVTAMAGGLVLFVGVALEEGLPQLERYVTGSLHAMARAAGAQLAAGRPLAIYIGNPMKPSVFFYLPAAALQRPLPPTPDEPLLPESNDLAPIRAFLATAQRPAYMLTDSRRASELEATAGGIRTAERSGRWLLLRADPESAGAPVTPAPSQKPGRL